MSNVMTSDIFIQKAKKIATKYETAYLLGGFGFPANKTSLARLNMTVPDNKKMQLWQTRAKDAFDKGFYFDCVGLIKGILWGWKGDKSNQYGGAKYASNQVPDTNADGMIKLCTNGGSADFNSIIPGECVWMNGHIGIYLGDGLVVESTPKWDGGVQLSVCTNVVTSKSGYTKTRRWTKHGKLPWIDYGKSSTTDHYGKLYKVVKGDSLSAIAKKTGIDVMKLVDFNGLKLSSIIYPNDYLMLEKSPEVAIDKLYTMGIINSPEYWKTKYKVQDYVGILLLNSAQRVKRNGTLVKTPTEAIANMVKAGVIVTPGYWLELISKPDANKTLMQLIIALGSCQYK